MFKHILDVYTEEVLAMADPKLYGDDLEEYKRRIRIGGVIIMILAGSFIGYLMFASIYDLWIVFSSI